MSGCRRRMAGLCVCKGPRTRLPVGASALGFFVLCWLYIFPVYRLPDEKEIVQGVLLQQGKVWRRNLTAVAGFRKLLEDCCNPSKYFAMTKDNSPVGKNLWFDGEFLYSFTIDNETFALFPKATPFQLPLKRCSVVGNGGILKKSSCGRQIDQADFVMRCNLPPLSSEYTKDVGSKTQLVTANPSIIKKRFQNLLWSRKAFVDSVKVYNQSYIYMPAFSMKAGTEPSLRVYYTLVDFGAKQTVIFANPNFLRDIGKFWKSKGIHGKRLSTGLFLVSAALGTSEVGKREKKDSKEDELIIPPPAEPSTGMKRWLLETLPNFSSSVCPEGKENYNRFGPSRACTSGSSRNH